jgi:hypothetical protein
MFAAAQQPEYEHTQWAPMYWLLLAPALLMLLLAAAFSQQEDVALIMLAASAFLACMAYSFRSLRVVDEGDSLAIRYGTLPVFRKRIRYADIQAATHDRTSVVDGWGIHWVPCRGWTFNLWGFDCTRLILTSGRTIRIGTDDPHGLVQFLNRKLSQ